MKYGWLKDSIDERDLRAVQPRAALPKAVDLRPHMPKVYNQLELGSCSANAVCAVYQYTAMESRPSAANPSRLFTYYATREIEGNVSEDSGATLRGAMKSLAKYGQCLESTWPYKPERFTVRPSQKCFDYAIAKRITAYAKVDQTAAALKGQLAAGNPIAFGFLVPSSFEDVSVAGSGVFKMPRLAETINGGHAVVLVGYDDARGAFVVRNSWGQFWGERGYVWMPYEFILSPDWAFDFWTISSV